MSKRRIALLALLAALAALLALAFAGLPVVTTLARMVLVAVALLALFWGLSRFYRRALWKVGRRLAFSYFLIGVVPIPLALLLLAAAGYLGAGVLLGHVYRDAVAAVRADLDGEAAARLALARAGVAQPEALRIGSSGVPRPDGGAAAGAADSSPAGPATGEESEPSGWALYRGGRRTAGDPRLPAEWPAWAARAGDAWFVAGPKQAPTLAAADGDGAPGVIAIWPGDLAEELRERAGVWIDHLPPSADADRGLTVDLGDRRWTFQRPPDDPARKARAEAFFAARRPAPAAEAGEADETGETAGDPEEPPLRDRPLLFWGQLSGPVRSLADGAELHPYFFSSLRATPRGLAERFQSPDETGLDASMWGALLIFAFLLFDVYAVAAVMAAVMIFALSHAFNRLSSATQAVRAGDFSVRIPVKRRDQVGELQRSFNGMTQELEHLVATAAEKEVLEKELAIARELQRSLLPRELPGGEAVEFSTLFAPSAAIGGDYFDVLGLGDGRLAVVIADVSGHGLPSGLRMAMLKAALTILVEAELDAEGILGRLHEMVRSGDDRRVFVTATLALADLAAGTLEITNAGHPPTYLLRGGTVEEILLPSSPLGGLGRDYGRRLLELHAGDVLVWLSDGLIEATDADGRPFGYDGVLAALEAAATEGQRLAIAAAAAHLGSAAGSLTAAAVRDRLLAAVEAHAGGRPVEDDRTVVVMRYKAAAPS